MPQESSAPKLSTTITIKKFDHHVDPPQLVETITAKDGVIIDRVCEVEKLAEHEDQ